MAVTYAKPDDTTDQGGWDVGPTSGQNFEEYIDDVPNDGGSTFVYKGSTGLDSFTVSLEDVNDPGTSSGHVLHFWYKTEGDPSPTLKVELMQGSTTICSQSGLSNTGSSYVDVEYTLTSTEADSITNYSNLSIRVTSSFSGGGLSDKVYVTSTYLELPLVSVCSIVNEIGPIKQASEANVLSFATAVNEISGFKQGLSAVGINDASIACALSLFEQTAIGGVTLEASSVCVIGNFEQDASAANITKANIASEILSIETVGIGEVRIASEAVCEIVPFRQGANAKSSLNMDAVSEFAFQQTLSAGVTLDATCVCIIGGFEQELHGQQITKGTAACELWAFEQKLNGQIYNATVIVNVLSFEQSIWGKKLWDIVQEIAFEQTLQGRVPVNGDCVCDILVFEQQLNAYHHRPIDNSYDAVIGGRFACERMV